MIDVTVSYSSTLPISREEWEGMTDSDKLSYLADVPMNAYTIQVDDDR